MVFPETRPVRAIAPGINGSRKRALSTVVVLTVVVLPAVPPPSVVRSASLVVVIRLGGANVGTMMMIGPFVVGGAIAVFVLEGVVCIQLGVVAIDVVDAVLTVGWVVVGSLIPSVVGPIEGVV